MSKVFVRPGFLVQKPRVVYVFPAFAAIYSGAISC